MIRWLLTAVTFGVFYLKEVVVSNFRVAREVVSPRLKLDPCIVGIPVDECTDTQIWMLATLLTMTPGSISLEVDEEKQVLYLHTLYADPSPDELRAQIKERYERPVRILF